MDIILVVLASYFIIRRWKLHWALVIIMALGTKMFLFSKFFSDFLFIPNITDGALVLIVLMYYNFKDYKIDETPYKTIYSMVTIFLAYLAFIAFVDVVVNETSIISVIKTSRHWLCMLIIFVIPRMPYLILDKALKIIFYITIFASVIIIIEFSTGTEVFTATMVENGIKRGALPTYYALFYTMLVFSDFYKFQNFFSISTEGGVDNTIKPCTKGYSSTKLSIKYFFLGILVVSQLVSATRSISLAIILGIAVCIWYLSENKIASFLRLGGLCLVIYFASFAFPSLHERFNDAFQEMAGFEQSSKNMDVEGNTTFRLFMLTERYEYLKTSPQKYLFGIGNVIEQDFPTIFAIGGFDREMQRPTQLDTGDISWSSIILRTGMIGLIIYMFIVFSFVFYKYHCKNDRLITALKAYLLATLIVVSFASAIFARGEFWIMPILCISIVTMISKKNGHSVSNIN